MSESGVILEIENVSKHFGGVKAVEDVSLNVERGKIVSLIGPNGAGKTTLFNTVTGMYPVTSGRIHFTDAKGHRRRLTRRRPDQITCLGIARTFQNIRLFSALTTLDNVKIGLHARCRGGLLGSVLWLPTFREECDVTKAAMAYLDFVGLSGHESTEAGSFAYGDRRRLEIARALATHPSLLLLDEPAAGLNPAETRVLMALIRKIRDQGITVFLIEHDMRLVMEISDHVHVLDHGEVICEGKPSDVQCDKRVIEAYLGHDASEKMVPREDGGAIA